MKAIDLRNYLDEAIKVNPNNGDNEVCIPLSKPSIGGFYVSKVKYASLGFDWNHGRLFIVPEKELVEKTEKEKAFDMAYELLAYLASKPSKRQSYEQRKAIAIFKKLGYTEERIETIRKVFHG